MYAHTVRCMYFSRSHAPSNPQRTKTQPMEGFQIMQQLNGQLYEITDPLERLQIVGFHVCKGLCQINETQRKMWEA